MLRETVTLEFEGGSLDGGTLEAKRAPEYLEVSFTPSWQEIYELQSTDPPFVYVQIGYAQKEHWN